MAEESKTGNLKKLGEQMEDDILDTLDAGNIVVEKEGANVADIAAAKKKKNTGFWPSKISHKDKGKLKKLAAKEKEAKVQEDAAIAAQKVEEERIKAENKARKIQEKANLQAKAYEQDKAKLQLKINIYIEEIGVLEQGFAEKLKTNFW